MAKKVFSIEIEAKIKEFFENTPWNICIDDLFDEFLMKNPEILQRFEEYFYSCK